MLEFLNNVCIPKDINITLYSLYLQYKKPITPKEYISISMCNMVINIVTKVIANKLKPILSNIVDEEKFTFVKGELITNNALIDMECFQ